MKEKQISLKSLKKLNESRIAMLLLFQMICVADPDPLF
jgi:hypothetical protein